MSPRGWSQLAGFVALVGASLLAIRPALAEEKPARKTNRAWTLKEARAEQQLHPRDPYLQYVALQLARREGKQEEVAKLIEQALGGDPRDRRGQVDLFGIFTGALAVQESLQLDALRTPNARGAARTEALLTVKQGAVTVVEKVPYTVAKQVPVEIEKDGVKTTVMRSVYQTTYKEVTRTVSTGRPVTVPKWPVAGTVAAGVAPSGPGPLLTATTLAAWTRRTVDLAELSGPAIKSHPWRKMLAGRRPEIPPLARCVPDDFYFAEFRSLNRLLEALEVGDLWSTHVYNQAVREARTQRVGERLKEQLAVPTGDLLRPFYDRAVAEVAVTGSDLFLREGSDVTLLFRLRRPGPFKARMDVAWKEAEKRHPGCRISKGEHLGVSYVRLSTPDRGLHVFAAYPRADLHVRSNSLPALRRIIEAIRGRDAGGKPVRRLGDTAEFAYIRTLLPPGAPEEDGLIYLSDPFIRRLVGPRLKLTERRRVLCYNHLRMLGHASLLYRTEFGRAPRSLAELVQTRCLPERFGEGPLACPDGGAYSLSADGAFGVCSRHGHAHDLRPCCEIALDLVTAEEADDYAAFREEYDQYWRTYFDPIAIRVQVSPRRYRLETVVLPLIDNSIYTGLAAALGGEPEPLDALPVPKGNIFSVNFRLDKAALHRQLQGLFAGSDNGAAAKHLAVLGAAPSAGLPAAAPWPALAAFSRDPLKDFANASAEELKKLGIPEEALRKLTYGNVRKVLYQGLGNQIGFHVYDAEPHVDFNLPQFLGDLLRLSGGPGGSEALIPFVLFLVSSANSPAYLSVPVQDAALVDDFAEALDAVAATLARGHIRDLLDAGVRTDFYYVAHPSKVVIRGNGIQFGPVKWRFFTARIGKAFYIATKQYILDDLIAAEAKAARDGKRGPGPVAHAMVRVRPENWKKTLADYRLGWAENNRQACLCNLGPLSHVARSFGAAEARDVRRLADRLHAVHFFCPDGGDYLPNRDGRAVTCSVHGWARRPLQQSAAREQADGNKLPGDLGGMTITLTFLEDGLRAVLTIDRKP